MEKRGYKLQEFVAHASQVNCLSIAKKTCRLLITGGDDYKVNLWSIGKHKPLKSLCGHSSSVESLVFDPAEVLVLSGASVGAIKLWDLEETKLVRSLTGHRSKCTAIEFHPFGEFFASGSTDTNLKIWDIRKKGCIHTYKGHTGGIDTIRFTPDGRWVVTGGVDNVVKVWDLTAGKHLHDFKFHEGPITSINFHPLEFLLATGSADRTVKFWDLETFEMIGSTKPENSGVRAISFNPDGKVLFCGLDDSLKIFSWEPVICHDAIELGWSTLGDLCALDRKVLGCSYYRNSVAVWVADISAYGSGPLPQEFENEEKTSYKSLPSSPEVTEDIKNIYIDCANGKPVLSRGSSMSSPDSDSPVNKMNMFPVETQKVLKSENRVSTYYTSVVSPVIVPREPAETDYTNLKRETIAFSKTKPGMLLRPATVRKPSGSPKNAENRSQDVESVINVVGKVSPIPEPVIDNKVYLGDHFEEVNVPRQNLPSSDIHHSSAISTVSKLPPAISSEPKCNDTVFFPKRGESIKIVNGVAVVKGRTRSLVEKFERQEKLSNEDQVDVTPSSASELGGASTLSNYVATNEMKDKLEVQEKTVVTTPYVLRVDATSAFETKTSSIGLSADSDKEDMICREDQSHLNLAVAESSKLLGTISSSCDISRKLVREKLSQDHHVRVNPSASDPNGRLSEGNNCASLLDESFEKRKNPISNDRLSSASSVPSQNGRSSMNGGREVQLLDSPFHVSERQKTVRLETNMDSAVLLKPCRPTAGVSGSTSTAHLANNSTRNYAVRSKSSLNSRSVASPGLCRGNSRGNAFNPTSSVSLRSNGPIKPTKTPLRVGSYQCNDQVNVPIVSSDISLTRSSSGTSGKCSRPDSERAFLDTEPSPVPADVGTIEKSNSTTEKQQFLGRDVDSDGCLDSSELMRSHEVFLNSLKSRLAKLQMVRHFWERNDLRGAINALKKLPDHSVQADVVSVLIDKIGILTLDLFSFLLPVLVGLLSSNTDRHASLALELVLKLAAVFGPLIRSTISSPPAVGTDVHAEERREHCLHCHQHLQQVLQILPALSRRSAALAKSALQLNLLLQQPSH